MGAVILRVTALPTGAATRIVFVLDEAVNAGSSA